MKKILFFVISVLVAQLLNSQSGKSWTPSEELVAKLSKQRTGINYYEEKVPEYVLPDPLTGIKGNKIASSGEWTGTRRNEILDLFRTHVFGRVPSTPYEVDFKTTNTDNKALDGAATLKQVDITIESGGKELVINLSVFTPNKAGNPVPAFLLINNRGQAVIDPTRKEKSEFWPVEEVIARGYAVAAFNNSDVDPDNFDEFKDAIHPMLDRGVRKDDSWGTLAAWVWGASRCLDYLVTDKSINASRIAVVGHSRGGKTALWAGAEDPRFAMVISNESGCGGAALARRKYGETVQVINTAFPHWFCTNYKNFNNNEDQMPVDMHMLLALSAPRLLYVACASDDLWGDPKGSYLALLNAVPVFSLFGKAGSLPSYMPPLNNQVVDGNLAFHIRYGGHNLLVKDWNMFMDFADSHWK